MFFPLHPLPALSSSHHWPAVISPRRSFGSASHVGLSAIIHRTCSLARRSAVHALREREATNPFVDSLSSSPQLTLDPSALGVPSSADWKFALDTTGQSPRIREYHVGSSDGHKRTPTHTKHALGSSVRKALAALLDSNLSTVMRFSVRREKHRTNLMRADTIIELVQAGNLRVDSTARETTSWYWGNNCNSTDSAGSGDLRTTIGLL